jgi:hypothetical protein
LFPDNVPELNSDLLGSHNLWCCKNFLQHKDGQSPQHHYQERRGVTSLSNPVVFYVWLLLQMLHHLMCELCMFLPMRKFIDHIYATSSAAYYWSFNQQWYWPIFWTCLHGINFVLFKTFKWKLTLFAISISTALSGSSIVFSYCIFLLM